MSKRDLTNDVTYCIAKNIVNTLLCQALLQNAYDADSVTPSEIKAALPKIKNVTDSSELHTPAERWAWAIHQIIEGKDINPPKPNEEGDEGGK